MNATVRVTAADTTPFASSAAVCRQHLARVPGYSPAKEDELPGNVQNSLHLFADDPVKSTFDDGRAVLLEVFPSGRHGATGKRPRDWHRAGIRATG